MNANMSHHFKIFILLGCLFCFSATGFATDEDLLRLEADMLKYMESKERNKFFSTTDMLKKASKEEGNERLFYQAWGNEGIFEATQQYYQKGHDIAKEIKNYAMQEGSAYGEYTAMHTEAMVLLQQKDYEAAQKAFIEAVDFRHRRFPNESAAEDLRELLRIAMEQKDNEKAKNYANQMLAEPNIAPHHKGRTLFRLSNMAFDSNDVEEFNHIYEEMKRLSQIHNIKMIDQFTEVNYYIINRDYKQALLLVDRLSPDTCAERKALIYHRLGDNDKAYEYMVKYKELSDSISGLSHDKSMASLYLRMNNDRLRLEQDILTHQNSQLRYRFYIAVAAFTVIILLLVAFKRRKSIRSLKHDNIMLDYSKKGVEKSLKDLNELSRYESKTSLPLDMPVRVNKLCDHLANVAQNHSRKNVFIVFQTEFSDDFRITTNAEALEKIISQMLNASATYLNKGMILLSCSDNGNFVMFNVVDTSSILAEHTEEQSDKRTQGEEFAIRYVSMNFNICQSISRLLHGRIWHDTEYTKGTRFCFEIPKNALSDIHEIEPIHQTTYEKSNTL